MTRWLTLVILCTISIYIFYIVEYEVYHTNYFVPLWPTFFEKYILIPFIQIGIQIILIGFILIFFKGIRRMFKYERASTGETLAILFVVGIGLYLVTHFYLRTYNLNSIVAMILTFVLLCCNSMFFRFNSQNGRS